MKKMYLSKDGLTLKRVTKNSEGDIVIPEGVVYLAKRALAGCEYITEVSLPSTLKEIGDEAFEGCISLTSIVIPHGVDNIPRRAFAGCSDLETINLPSSLSRIEKEAFCDCDELSSLSIPEGVTSIGDRAFYDCDSLKKVVIPSSLREFGNEAFKNCSPLESVTIPEGVTVIPEQCFKSTGLEEIVFPESLKIIEDEAFCNTWIDVFTIGPNVEIIGHRAFYHLNFTIWSLRIGASVRQIGEMAFWNNDIRKITVDPENETYADDDCDVIMEKKTGKVIYGSTNSRIPETATAIAHMAFSYYAPKVLVIPGSVKTIEANAFCGCKGCKFLLEEGVEVIEAMAFDEYEPCNSTVYIPSSVRKIGGQFASVEFHLDAANEHFRYDKEGKNIISADGELVWGRILRGMPSNGILGVSAMFNIDISIDELVIPRTVFIIDGNTLRYSSGVKKMQLYGGIKTNATDSTDFCCDIKVLTTLEEFSSGITEYIQYNIPKGMPRTEIDNALGYYSIFK